LARDLNGETDRIDWTTTTNWADVSGLTIAVWTNLDAIDHSTYFTMVHGSGDSDLGTIFWCNTSNQVNFTQWSNGTVNVFASTSSGPMSTSAGWQHVAVVWDGTGTAANVLIYVDGVLTALGEEINGTKGAAESTGSLSVGGRITDDNRNLNGQLAEITWWDIEQSAATILSLSKGHSPLFYPRGLKRYMPLIRGLGDLRHGSVGTPDGSTVVTHPPMIIPDPPHIITVPAAEVIEEGIVASQQLFT